MIVILPYKKATFLVRRKPGIVVLARGWLALCRELRQGILVWGEEFSVQEYRPERDQEDWLMAITRETVSNLRAAAAAATAVEERARKLLGWPITQADLDAMPDVTERWIALYQAPEDGTVFDRDGVCWLIGRLDGKRVKRRFYR